MKKLLLLSALLIFACSSDDSNDNNDDSNQNFLEKYDGVFWKETNNQQDNAEGYDWWYVFNQNSVYDCESFNSFCECSNPINWGQVYEDNFSLVISENSSERLVFLVTETDDNGPYEYTVSVDATNNGNRIEVTYSDEGPNYVEYYDRVSEQPCN